MAFPCCHFIGKEEPKLYRLKRSLIDGYRAFCADVRKQKVPAYADTLYQIQTEFFRQ